MALEQPSRTEAPAASAAGLTQKSRWLRFGSNVAVAILLATALTGAVIWLSGALLRGRARSDWTAAGRFSLSPRTKALLKDIPYEEVRLTNLYAHDPGIPPSVEYYERVQDLLEAYAAASGRIAVEAINPVMDVGGTEAFVARLRKRYEKELEKPARLVEEFDGTREELGRILEREAQRIENAVQDWTDGPMGVRRDLFTIAQDWENLRVLGEMTAAAVKSLTEQDLPIYSTAIARARELLRQANEALKAVPPYCERLRERLEGTSIPADVEAILAGAEETYKPIRERIEAYLKESEDVAELELEKVRRDIADGDVVVIETPDQVKVVSFYDVWPFNPDAGEDPDAPERTFDGESAVSSALLGMVRKDRPAVLFVTFASPATGWGGPFSQLAERLRRLNFIVEDWDLMRESEMPRPEHMTEPILVLVPPPPPNMQRPMPPATPEAYRPAVEAIEREGAAAVVLCEPSGMLGPSIPYRDLFAALGVDVRLEAIGVHKRVVDARGREAALPQFETNDLGKHTITRPLRALSELFFHTASPVLPASQPPAGVTVAPLALMPVGPDYWADTTIWEAMEFKATRSEADDIIPSAERPVPVAVAVERKIAAPEPAAPAPGDSPAAAEPPVPEPKVQKVVVVGDADFARDRVPTVFYPGVRLRSRALPGNEEFFVNSILWVAGTEHLITVSSEALQARRIGSLEGWELLLRIFVVGGLPVLVGIVGVVVYVLRRR